MKKNLPPFDELLQFILEEQQYSGLTVIQDIGSDSYDEIPLVSWTFVNQGQYAHGLWSGVLATTVLCETKDADKILSHLYKQALSWESLDRGELTAKKVGIESVSNSTGFDKIFSTLLNGKHISQFNAQFGLTINDYS